MNVKTVLRDHKSHFKCTIFREERNKMSGLSKGDILLFRVNKKIFIRKVLEDFVITLPKKLGLKPNSEIELELIHHITRARGVERPQKGFLGNVIDIKHFIPKRTDHGKDIIVIDDKDKIFVWFPIGGGVHHVCINRFVNLEPLFEVIGFLWGDGSTEGMRSMRFTNHEPSTLIHVINFFEDLGIARNTWKAQIIWSGAKKPTKSLKKECKEFWSNVLNLPFENIKSVSWSKGKSNKNHFGSARIFIDRAVLFEIFVCGILKWSIKEIERENSNLNILKCLLRGVSAAEACPSVNVNDSIRRVDFSFDPHSKECILFRTLLLKLGISSSKPDTSRKHSRFNVDGWKNFFNLFMLDVFKFHDSKRELFTAGFIHHRSTVSRLNKIRLLVKKKLRITEIARNINVTKECVSAMVKKLEKENIVNRSKNRIVLTPFGRNFLNHVNESKNWLSTFSNPLT